MSRIPRLKLINGAGDIEPSAALRIDVINAAERFYDAIVADETDTMLYHGNVAEREEDLIHAVRKMRRARARRQR